MTLWGAPLLRCALEPRCRAEGDGVLRRGCRACSTSIHRLSTPRAVRRIDVQHGGRPGIVEAAVLGAEAFAVPQHGIRVLVPGQDPGIDQPRAVDRVPVPQPAIDRVGVSRASSTHMATGLTRLATASSGSIIGAECCFADCLTVSFPDCFARQGGRFPGLFGRFDEARAGCRTAVGASSRCAAPALRFGPSGDPPPSARLSASMAVSGAFGHGPIARHIVVASA